MRVFQRLTQQMDPWRGESCRLKVHFIAFFSTMAGPRSSFPPARCLCVTAIELLLPALNFEKQKMPRRFVRSQFIIDMTEWRSQQQQRELQSRQQTTTKKRPKWVSSAIFLSVVKGEKAEFRRCIHLFTSSNRTDQ